MSLDQEAVDKKKSTNAVPENNGSYGNYKHDDEAVSRPDVGVQEQFNGRKSPKSYRYDSSLAPELNWDESAERDFAEWLLQLISESVEKGEAVVFAQEQVWKGTSEHFSTLAQCLARLKSLTQPFLNWTGKAERKQISVPTVPLFVHERHSTQAILTTLESHRSSGETLDLFGDGQEKDIADQLSAYTHKEKWRNRLILGDSLQVMNSLLEYEGLGGQVQTIYMDPPYGVKYGSNFQPFVRKRKVEHGKDEEMSREPEMVRAYRDTWTLGRHSYLTYLRDRLLLSKELLADSGSIFVQISDENLHLVRATLDEVFGEENFVAVINYKTMMPLESGKIESVVDYLCWYSKNKKMMKYHNIWMHKNVGKGTEFVFADTEDGGYRRLTSEEVENFEATRAKHRIFKRSDLTSSGYTASCTFPIEFEGKKYETKRGKSWRTTKDGVENLKKQNRLFSLGEKLYFKMYLDDFGLSSLTNQWSDTIEFGSRSYVVQTTATVIERCLHMTTDPGDLVFDLTCGSGTTAFTAEKWGRRWVTCDTSRVPLALARQRLLTATYPWFDLKDPGRGPSAGFVYKSKKNRKGMQVGGLVPRITLKSIANNEDPQTVNLVDKPEVNKKVTRVCGPFTVEATIQTAQSISVLGQDQEESRNIGSDARAYLDRMLEILRRTKNLRLPGNRVLQLESVRTVSDCESIHAEAVDGQGSRIAIAFGPEDGSVSSQQVFDAASEAYFLKYEQLHIFGFAIQAKARELVEDRSRLRLPCNYISVNPDVAMDDLLKTSHSDQLFSVTGLPDAKLTVMGRREDGASLYKVTLEGLDTFLPDSLETESIAADNLPCWMLDTNYNGMAFCATQVFFPRTSAWDNLQKSLKGHFNESVWEHLAGTSSEPFALGMHKQVAIKVIDDRGNELMRVIPESEAEE